MLGMRIHLEVNPEISGAVKIEGDKPVKLDHAMIRFGHDHGERIKDDLSISPILIKSIRAGETDILREGLTITSGAGVHLEIVLAPDGGLIEGAALDKDDNPVAGATVVAIPESALRVRSDRFYSASTDQHGRYELKNVAPGDYTILAWEDVEPGAWFDPDFLRDVESRGEPVKLNAQRS